MSGPERVYRPSPERVIRDPASPSTPILVIGGDHPYQQWLGDATRGGMLSIYERYGIRPYIAINTDSVATQNPGDTGYMTWGQLAAIKNRVYLENHGARHVRSWYRLNTGIRCQYTGAAATATVRCDGTNLIGTTAGAVADFSISLAGKTLAALATDVAAVAGWTCTLAAELTGEELATNVLTLVVAGAKNAKSPQIARIGCGGGIAVRYIGTEYRTAWVWKTGTALRLYGDGRVLASIDLSAAANDTLTELVATINALTGWIAALCDNDAEDSYISGAEASSSLRDIRLPDCIQRAEVVVAGLPRSYMVRRQMGRAAEVAALNGVTFTAFSQSAGECFAPHMREFADIYSVIRGNPMFGQYAPYAQETSSITTFMQHGAVDDVNSYASAAQCSALINALADSPGFTVDVLTHEVTPDGASGVALMPVIDEGLTETRWIAMLEAIRTQVAAGRLRVMGRHEIPRISAGAIAPNKLFNARLVNSGEALLGSTDNGRKVPGWQTIGGAAPWTALSITDGELSVTSNNSTVTQLMAQVVYLQPGKTYRVQARMSHADISSGNGVRFRLNRQINRQAISAAAGAANVFTTEYITTPQVVDMRFTVPAEAMESARIATVAGPFNLATNYNIRINIDGKGLTADIDCRGATPSATTAKEVAAAINAALAANASYTPEYHNAAEAVGTRVWIRSPYQYAGGFVSSFRVLVDQGSTLDAFSSLFGLSTTQDAIALGQNATLLPGDTSYWIFTVDVGVVGTVRLRDIAVLDV